MKKKETNADPGDIEDVEELRSPQSSKPRLVSFYRSRVLGFAMCVSFSGFEGVSSLSLFFGLCLMVGLGVSYVDVGFVCLVGIVFWGCGFRMLMWSRGFRIWFWISKLLVILLKW